MRKFNFCVLVIVAGLTLASGAQGQYINDGPVARANPPIVHGQVVLESGAPLGRPVEILRVCGARAMSAALTNAQGKFSFVLTGDGPIANASEGGGTPDFGVQVGMGLSSSNRTSFWGCAVRANYPGYASTTVSLQGKDFATPVDIGKIVLKKVDGTEAAADSETSAKAPDAARKEFDRAREDFAKKSYADTEKHVAKAVEMYPAFAAAWDLRGRNQRMLKQDREAEKCFLAALKADDKYISPYMQLASLNAGWEAWQNVLIVSAKVIELDAVNHPDAYFMKAYAHYKLNQLADAETTARKSVELDKDHRFPRASLLLGDILQAKGDDKEAAEQFRSYLKLEPNSQESKRINEYLAKVDGRASSN